MFQRYALYYLPPTGALADAAASWLGWDCQAGQPCPHPDSDLDLPALTERARKYGFHATLKAPFRLASGRTETDLRVGLRELAARTPSAQAEGLQLSWLGGFTALTLAGDTQSVDACVADLMRELDPFRAPLTESDLARRRQADLTPHQDALLQSWGYPYVLDEFQFHMTLSGKVPETLRPRFETALQAHLGHLVPRPFLMNEVALCGEAAAGFHEIERFALVG